MSEEIFLPSSDEDSCGSENVQTLLESNNIIPVLDQDIQPNKTNARDCINFKLALFDSSTS